MEQTKTRLGERTIPDPDQPDEYVGRDEYGMPLDGRGRHLTKEQRLAERDDVERYFRGERDAPQYQIDWSTGEVTGRIMELPDGTKYVEPISMRDLFPEERKSRNSIKE